MKKLGLFRLFGNFFQNARNLLNNNLDERYVSFENIHRYLDNLKYEMSEDIRFVKKPKIASPQATIEKIIKDRVSISRFGDGEFELLFNRSIPFQSSNNKLSERLKEILTSNLENLIIGIPYIYWYTVSHCNIGVKNFVRNNISLHRREYEMNIDFSRQYYSTEFTQLYMMYDDNNDFMMADYFEYLRQLWDDRDITIIQGEGITNNLKYNIFDNSKSVTFIYGPSNNAFSVYNQIVEKAKQINKDRLILIILGPTATVLAYDLAQLGYQALDIGHAAKDYDFYKRGMRKDLANVYKFFSPD